MGERAVGITTTVPMEVLFASGHAPVDLNNVFITSDEPLVLVEEAERAGFPRTMCAWVKGIYAAARRHGISTVVAVVQGDCSNTHALMEILEAEGVRVLDFAFPYRRDTAVLETQIRRLAEALGTTLDAAEAMKQRLDKIRATVGEIDRLTWQTGQVTGAENFEWTINCSDFRGDPDRYGAEAQAFLEAALEEPPVRPRIRLGLLGVPPICSDLFARVAELGAEVVFNEMPRQFAMPGPSATLVEQYARYTYPYDVFGRIQDINRQIAQRRLDGVIHYTQTFCFRQIEDLLIKQGVNCPVLTIQGERPAPLDARNTLRIEAFIETLRFRALSKQSG